MHSSSLNLNFKLLLTLGGKQMNKKSGISLIALTIIIIVLSILTMVIIAVLEKQDTINSAKETVTLTNIESIRELASDIYTNLQINIERGINDMNQDETVSQYIERKLLDAGASQEILNKLTINSDGTIEVTSTLEY